MRCRPTTAGLDIQTRLALLEGHARDQAAVIDEMRCQLIDCQRRLQALEGHFAGMDALARDLRKEFEPRKKVRGPGIPPPVSSPMTPAEVRKHRQIREAEEKAAKR